MVITLSLSFVDCGELWRVLETCYESYSCRLLVYVLWMSLRLHGFTSSRCCKWIGYRFDIIFCNGSFLVNMWQVLLLRLQIEYIGDVRFTWFTFGDIDSWMGWHLLWVLFHLWIF